MSGGDLIYGTNPGCVASSSRGGGTPGQCGGVEAWAVQHRYRYPKPHTTRLYTCDHHGRNHPGAEALTDQDQQIIAARRNRERRLLSPAGR